MIQQSVLVIHTPLVAIITLLVIRLENKPILVVHHKLAIFHSILPFPPQLVFSIYFLSLSVLTVILKLSFKHLHSVHILFTVIIPIAMPILSTIHQSILSIILFTITMRNKRPLTTAMIGIIPPPRVLILFHTTLIEFATIHQLHNHLLPIISVSILPSSIFPFHRYFLLTYHSPHFLHSILSRHHRTRFHSITPDFFSHAIFE